MNLNFELTKEEDMQRRDLTPLLTAFLTAAAVGTIVTAAVDASAEVIVVCDEDGFCEADDPDKNPPPPPEPPDPPPDPGPIAVPPVDIPDFPGDPGEGFPGFP